MKAIRLLKTCLALIVFAFGTVSLHAQDCELPIAVYLEDGVVNIPPSSAQLLSNQLRRLVAASGVGAEVGSSQFVLTAHVDQIDKQVANTAPTKIINQLGISLYIADVVGQKTFASAYVEVRGMGNNETRSMTNAFSQLTASNQQIKAMFDEGKAKIIEYYESQAPNLLKEAQRFAGAQKFDEAMAVCASIPACSSYGDDAIEYATSVYLRNLDRLNQLLLSRARAAWAASPDQNGASQAGIFLSAIDPESTSFDEAQNLYKEIKKQVRSDIDFEVRQKHNDAVRLESQRIAAARAVAVAFWRSRTPHIHKHTSVSFVNKQYNIKQQTIINQQNIIR